ncbi:alcohol dehydrogenase [Rhodoferax koreense]|uniref:Alcohol dehydrogenase n=1 Tax=Rhodoferax koreensis TaxID=1842727 RepID=A0A1P8JT26_9BURK|nr:cytochrome c [Rhodoferax koreense]APW36871.1 alcohol dehydrogenase [Rhodoferax koreense]
MKKLGISLLAACAVAITLAAWVWHLNLRDEPDLSMPSAAVPASPELLARGAYLALAGNCASCHTTRGGVPYAGGRGIETPFGTVFTSNLTPDVKTGIGAWTPAEFWRAMHNGRARDGRLLYPAFPYTSYTEISRADADALYAYLHNLPATEQPATPHTVRFPYNQQPALAVWRALYFTPGAPPADADRSAEWNRGAYLVRGLGHCGACHTARNALGATDDRLNLAGGMIPMQNWYAPSLTSPHEAGVAGWPREDIVRLLQTGVAPGGSVLGPMAEVVLKSTQHLNEGDLGAMATYLKALPQSDEAPVSAAVDSRVAARGSRLYEQHCAQCHGEQGQGVPGAYPPLAGNRAVTMPKVANLVQAVLNGGYAPATAGNPRPYGMPPFVLVLNDADVAAVLTHVRNSWGNQAGGVAEVEVNRLRAGQGR